MTRSLSIDHCGVLMVRQRTQLINALRSMLAEFGVFIARGLARIISFSQGVLAGNALDVPGIAQDVVHTLCGQLDVLHGHVRWYETDLRLEAKRDARVRLLQTIPGIGVVTASAIAASVGSGHPFRSGREFAAWLGLTPINRSSGGKERSGRITTLSGDCVPQSPVGQRMGDQYLRQRRVVGMTSLVRRTKSHPERANKWLTVLLERKPARLATVAMANKTARIAWAVLTKNEPYMPRTA